MKDVAIIGTCAWCDRYLFEDSQYYDFNGVLYHPDCWDECLDTLVSTPELEQ